MKDLTSFFREESGSVAVIVGIALTLLLGCAALAIDLGHLYVVKQELQNAADAGSMAGADSLAPYLIGNGNTLIPNWDAAQAVASTTTKENKTDKTLITDCQVQAGYFNLLSKVLQSTAITPTTVDVPAVRVTVSRVAGQNTGAVLPFIAQILGINFMNVSAQATAMLSCPSTANRLSLFPVAVNKGVIQILFNTSDGNPGSGLSQPFNIGSDYHYPDLDTGNNEVAGEWTSFFDQANDVPTIKNLINGSNPSPISISQLIQCVSDIWVQPGTKNSLYNDVANVPNLVKADGTGKTVFLPVVNLNSLDTHAWNPVYCYLPVKILDSVGKNKKYIQVKLVNKAKMPSDNVGGPCYGAFSQPRIVQ